MAAGLGFKTFTTGEVLTAADTNGYLMQGVLVFASSAARAAAITSPQEGQYSYLKDTNSTEYYDGAAWIAAPIGDITGVTAGTGISGGGTSGTVTITNSMATEIAAKGDLIVGTGAATFDNLTVGANGTTLVADSSTATGLKWATPASGSTYVGCSAYKTGSQSLTAGAYTAINWEAENWDTNAFHDNATNPSRFTIPSGKAGYYNFIFNLGIGSATGQVYWQVLVNGSAVSNCANNVYASETKLFQSVTIYCNVGDYVQWTVYKSTVITTAGNQTEAWASINYMGA